VTATNHQRLLRLALSLAVALGAATSACDSALPTDDTEGIESAGSSERRPDLQTPFADPDDDDQPIPQAVTPPAAVPAMAHDVSLWTTPIEGPELIDFTDVDGTLYTSTGLAKGWRLDRWDRPATGDALVLTASRVEGSADALPPLLLTTDDRAQPGIVVWVDAGTLLIRRLAPISAEHIEKADIFVEGDPTAAFFATDTNALESAPVATAVRADHTGPERFFVCASENVRGVICTFMHEDGQVDGWLAVGKLHGYAPLAVAPSADGYVGLAASCRDDDCDTKQLVSLHFDTAGQIPRKRGLRTIGTIQARKAPIVARTNEGLFISAVRSRAQDATAWHITGSSAHELDGTFSRIQGAVFLESVHDTTRGETWLLEESPLLMRGGFPVSLLRPLRWSAAIGREEPLAWPRAVYERLPGQPGQRVISRGGIVAILPAQRDARMDGTFLQLLANGDETSAPTPSRDKRSRRGRGRRR